MGKSKSTTALIRKLTHQYYHKHAQKCATETNLSPLTRVFRRGEASLTALRSVSVCELCVQQLMITLEEKKRREKREAGREKKEEKREKGCRIGKKKKKKKKKKRKKEKTKKQRRVEGGHFERNKKRSFRSKTAEASREKDKECMCVWLHHTNLDQAWFCLQERSAAAARQRTLEIRLGRAVTSQTHHHTACTAVANRAQTNVSALSCVWMRHRAAIRDRHVRRRVLCGIGGR